MDESERSINYLVFESVQVRLERMNRRLWILCIILIIALIGTNIAWFYYESQFEESTEVSQEVDTGEGDATVIGIGDYYGENQTDR